MGSTVTMTAVVTCGPPGCNVPFVIDGNGGQCIDLGAVTNDVYVTNLAGGTFRVFSTPYTVCGGAGLNPPPSWLFANGEIHHIAFGGIFPPPGGLALSTQNTNAGTYQIRVDWPDGPTFCQYGTELTPGGQFLYYLTPGLIDTWLVTSGLTWLAPIFTSLYFSQLNASALCGNTPPPLPTIDLSTPASGVQTIQQVLAAIAWPALCRCKAGTPAPTQPPLPSATQPSGWILFPVQPTGSGPDAVDLQVVKQLLTQLQSQVATLTANNVVSQRWRLPFGVVAGKVHSNLSGTGSIQVSRLIGLRVDVTTRSPNSGTIIGNPEYWTNLGWLAVDDGGAMLQETRVTRSKQDW